MVDSAAICVRPEIPIEGPISAPSVEYPLQHAEIPTEIHSVELRPSDDIEVVPALPAETKNADRAETVDAAKHPSAEDAQQYRAADRDVTPPALAPASSPELRRAADDEPPPRYGAPPIPVEDSASSRKELSPVAPTPAESYARPSTEPRTTIHEISEPEISEPEISEPEVKEPPISEPKAIEPPTREPDKITPEPTEPKPSDPKSGLPSAKELFGQRAPSQVLLEPGGIGSAASRTWRDVSGKHFCRARLEKVDAAGIVLVTAAGQRAPVGWGKLSSDDLRFLQRQVTAKLAVMALERNKAQQTLIASQPHP